MRDVFYFQEQPVALCLFIAQPSVYYIVGLQLVAVLRYSRQTPQYHQLPLLARERQRKGAAATYIEVADVRDGESGGRAGHQVPEHEPGAAYRMLEFLLGRIESLETFGDFTTQTGDDMA